MSRAFIAGALAAGALVAAASPAPAQAGEWVAGDLHVHTTFSHDSYGGPGDDNTGPEEAFTLGHTVASQFAVAASRGLDYLAITDHNDVRARRAPGYGSRGVLAIPGYENSLDGHAQMLGARRLYHSGEDSAPAVRRLAWRLRRDGGAFQANHPSDSWEYGYRVPVDAVEVWNLPWPYQPPFPAATDNERALRYWQGWLDRGLEVAATGGSDNHFLATTTAQGAGQPTTWVHVRRPTVRGVLAGLRRGHTFVSHQPPAYGGPRVLLEADGDRDGRYESIVGDRVPRRSPLRVRVLGAPAAELRVVTDGGRAAFDPVPVSSARFEHRFRLPRRASWVRAEVYGEDVPELREAGCASLIDPHAGGGFPTTYCTNRVAMLALSSALYLGR